MYNHVVNYIMLFVFLVLMLLAGIRFIERKIAPVRTVQAKVIEN